MIELIEAADKERKRLADLYQTKVDAGTSQMGGNMDWARLEGAVSVVAAVRKYFMDNANEADFSPVVIAMLDKEVHFLKQELAYKQSVIDALMLEYCPEEMTPEQLEEWSKHQVVSDYQPDKSAYTFATNTKENT